VTQRFDIDTAECPSLRHGWKWLWMSKARFRCPFAKFDKFNQPKFQGRRWPWVDPMKDAKADQMAIDSCLTSRTRICNENGDDFEEIVEEQAMEKILMEEAGLHVSNAAELPIDDPDLQDEPPPAKPAKKNRLAV
jgi:capsid protein